MRRSRWKDEEEGKKRRREKFKGEALELTEENMGELEGRWPTNLQLATELQRENFFFCPSLSNGINLYPLPSVEIHSNPRAKSNLTNASKTPNAAGHQRIKLHPQPRLQSCRPSTIVVCHWQTSPTIHLRYVHPAFHSPHSPFSLPSSSFLSSLTLFHSQTFSTTNESGSEVVRFKKGDITKWFIDGVLLMPLSLSTLLSDIGLNIQEAHVFSTIDGYSSDIMALLSGFARVYTEVLQKSIGAVKPYLRQFIDV
uniref:Uncharacterized protein n=1 Tax=Cucumis melo TaxID=3656 RepID=A0A9I9EDG9_CUCME